MLTGKEKRQLRAEGSLIKAELWIGKEGITDGTFQSLENSFQTKDLVKIKIHKSSPLEKKDAADILCSQTGAELVQVLGNTLLLYRPLTEDNE